MDDIQWENGQSFLECMKDTNQESQNVQCISSSLLKIEHKVKVLKPAALDSELQRPNHSDKSMFFRRQIEPPKCSEKTTVILKCCNLSNYTFQGRLCTNLFRKKTSKTTASTPIAVPLLRGDDRTSFLRELK